MSKWKEYLRGALGPGLITGASDDDPSGIATYTQAGAIAGLSFLWTTFFTLPFMVAIEELSARIALVTGRGLIRNLKQTTSRSVVAVLVLLLLIANVINIGADLGMMAASAQLVVHAPFWAWLLCFAGLTLALEIFLHYKTYARYLRWLTLALFAYVIVGLSVSVPWHQAFLATTIPHLAFTKEALMLFLALLGTTISPYLFFWEAGQVLEEERLEGHISEARPRQSNLLLVDDIGKMRADVGTGMIFSNTVSWFIILTSGVVLHQLGILSVDTPDQAARVLAPVLGSWSQLLFALGVIGTGLLAIPVLSASAAYACAELFSMNEGLNESWNKAKFFYGVIVLSGVVGFFLNFSSVSPIDALIYSAVCNALIAAPLVFFLIQLGNNALLMGRFVSGRWSRIGCWGVFFLMGISSLAWLAFQIF